MIYDLERSKEDLRFILGYKAKWSCFYPKEERIRHKAKWWGCWLRHHRRQRSANTVYYIFCIMRNRDSQESRAFDYINSKKD